MEFRQIVADTTAHVDQKNVVRMFQLHDQVGNGVESSVHPAGPTLVVGGHVVVELRSMDGMVPQKFEEMRVGPKAQLEGAVLAVDRGTVVALSEMGRESEKSGRDAASPMSVSLA